MTEKTTLSQLTETFLARPAVIGDRYRAADGTTFIVALLDQDSAYDRPYAVLTQDCDLLADDGYEDCYLMAPINIIRGHGALEPIDADLRMTAIVRRRFDEDNALPAGARKQMLIDEFNIYTARIQAAAGSASAASAARAEGIRYLVGLTGSQAAAAAVLGVNQSTVSRALRERA